MFNPCVKVFRLHWHATVPCFDLLSTEASSQSGRELFSSHKYYESDIETSDLQLYRLGRRAQVNRQVGKVRLRPHRFWGTYMSAVAAHEFRGAWWGLAPFRVVFKRRAGKHALCLPPKFTIAVQTPSPSEVRVRAYPKAYIWPIGWTVGVVIQIEGAVNLSEVPAILDELRSATVFLARGQLTTLNDGIVGLDAIIRSAFLRKDVSRYAETLNLYSTSSPISFDGQRSFDGLAVDLDLPCISSIIGSGAMVPDDRRILTRTPDKVAITAFNRGTFQVTGMRPKHETNERSPACALSNLKNALLMTSLMQKYHQKATGRNDPATLEMRNQVPKTFEVLKSKWENPHFRQVCERNQGIQKLLAAARSQPEEAIVAIKEDSMTQRLNTILAFTFGTIFVTAILVLVVLIPEPKPMQWRVFCVVLALAAGGVATTISGMLKVSMQLGKRVLIGATGALAVFVIVYFFVPAMAR